MSSHIIVKSEDKQLRPKCPCWRYSYISLRRTHGGTIRRFVHLLSPCSLCIIVPLLEFISLTNKPWNTKCPQFTWNSKWNFSRRYLYTFSFFLFFFLIFNVPILRIIFQSCSYFLYFSASMEFASFFFGVISVELTCSIELDRCLSMVRGVVCFNCPLCGYMVYFTITFVTQYLRILCLAFIIDSNYHKI